MKPGEIAVMLRTDGALISHLVVGTAPVRTESFDGKPDAEGLEVLGSACTRFSEWPSSSFREARR